MQIRRGAELTMGMGLYDYDWSRYKRTLLADALTRLMLICEAQMHADYHTQLRFPTQLAIPNPSHAAPLARLASVLKAGPSFSSRYRGIGSKRRSYHRRGHLARPPRGGLAGGWRSGLLRQAAQHVQPNLTPGILFLVCSRSTKHTQYE